MKCPKKERASIRTHHVHHTSDSHHLQHPIIYPWPPKPRLAVWAPQVSTRTPARHTNSSFNLQQQTSLLPLCETDVCLPGNVEEYQSLYTGQFQVLSVHLQADVFMKVSCVTQLLQAHLYVNTFIVKPARTMTKSKTLGRNHLHLNCESHGHPSEVK